MDQEVKGQDMNSNLEKNGDADRKVYEISNMSTILEPKSLWTKEQLAWHQMSLIRVGVKREVWIGVPSDILVPMRGIKFEVYLKEGDIHAFPAPSAIQEHREKKNPNDELLLVDVEIFQAQNLWIVSQWNDYNKCTNAPFVYYSTSPKYYELVED